MDQIAWTVGSDMDVICLSTQEGTNIVKKLMTVADAVCSITASRGATEAAMVDHDMSPMTKDWDANNLF